MSVNPLQSKDAIKLRAIVSLVVAALIGVVASANSYASKAGSTAAAGDPSTEATEDAAPTLTPAPPSSTPAPAASTPVPTKAATPTPARSVYRNGTYTATGTYDTSEGLQDISITLTVSGDVVTGTSAQNLADNRESSSYEARFISSYRAYVVGKPLASLALGKIAGASLTPKGFNDAAAQIRAQAR
jgi:uncharacterized protein with FMN-binding domain